MNAIFPFLQPELVALDSQLPVFKEVLWDFETDKPVFKNGRPVKVERMEAVRVWVWNALHTQRWRYDIFTPDYGHDLTNLIGQNSVAALKRSEAAAYIRDCLLVSPYITDVADVVVSLRDDVLCAGFRVVSVYGDFKMEV